MSDLHLPEAFTQRIQAQFGTDALAFFAALEGPAPVSIRLNPAKMAEWPGTTPIPWSETGRYLPERPAFILDPRWHAGAYYVQEASSMFLEQAWKRICEEEQPTRVLDLCGAPGGKSTHLLSLMDPEAVLVANEVIQQRAGVLAENVTRWGKAQALVTRNDPKDFDRLPGFFDVIVADAPCSGEGLFRRDAEAASQWSESHLQLCAERQRRILADVWPALKTGGFLVYSTCTFNPGENEENLDWLAQTLGASTVPLTIPVEWGVEEVTHNGVTGYRFLPHRAMGEGFFMALVQKTSEVSGKMKSGRVSAPHHKILGRLNEWVLDPEGHWWQHGERNLRLSGGDPGIWADLILNLRVVQAGVPLAEEKGKDLLPLPEAAFCTDLNHSAFNCFDLCGADALTYLRRDAQTLDGPSGWGLVRAEGLGLGFVKHLGNRTNNYYPQNWRIRKA